MISIVLPTYQEKDNIVEQLRRVGAALAGEEHEVIVVDDDSPDGTWREAEAYARSRPNVSVLRRTADKGLSGAVIAGFRKARGDLWGVMDADLSHDAGILPRLVRAVREGCDVAVGSRRVPGGGADRWPWHRRLASDVATRLALWLLPVPLADPMSGFFVVRREALAPVLDALHPRGYKILLEVVMRIKGVRVAEVPYVFKDRRSGHSKLTASVLLSYLESLLDLRFGWRPGDALRDRFR